MHRSNAPQHLKRSDSGSESSGLGQVGKYLGRMQGYTINGQVEGILAVASASKKTVKGAV